MNNNEFPLGWNEARVKCLIDRYENMSEDELLAEDGAARKADEQTIVIIPTELVPEVRMLLGRKASPLKKQARKTKPFSKKV